MPLLRLIEHQPAWELHTLMRFRGVQYTSDHSPYPVALGRATPVITDDATIHFHDNFLDVINSHASDKLDEDFLDADRLVASYINDTLIKSYHQWRYVTKEDRKDLANHASIGINWKLTIFHDLQSLFTIPTNPFHLFYSGLVDKRHEHELLKKLEESYKHLDEKLKGNKGSIVNNWSNYYRGLVIQTYGYADALLFAHIISALSNKVLKPIIGKYESLMEYFNSIVSKYYSFNSHEPLFNVTQVVLLNNPYLQDKEFEELRQQFSFVNRHVDFSCFYKRTKNASDKEILSKYEDVLCNLKEGLVDWSGPIEQILKRPSFLFATSFNLFVAVSFLSYGLSSFARHRH